MNSHQFPQMVYRVGGPHEIHGGRFDYDVAVDADELAAMLASGWHLTTTEAVASVDATLDTSDENASITRAELEQKARELGIEFSSRLGDTKLAERIEAALAKG